MRDLSLKVVITAITDGFKSAINGTVSHVNGMMGKLADTTRFTVNSVLAGVMSLPGAITAILGGAAISATLGITRQFQILEASIKTATKGLQDEAMPIIKAFAARTPFDVEQVTNAFIKLVNFGLDPSEAALESYGNTASALGKNLNQMVEAVADATTGEFERLKEFGIRASKQGDDIEFTFQGIKTTVGNNAREIENYLISIGKNNFAGAMADRAKTLDGALSNLGDSWRNLLVTITSSGFDDIVAGFARRASDAFDGLSKIISSGVIQAGISTITTAFDGFASDISKTMALVTEIVVSSFGKWDDKGTSVARKLTSEFQAWLNNTRSFIQIATVEAASWWDKLLVTLDGSRNSMRKPFEAQQEQIDVINKAREESISAIIDEHNVQKKANDETLSAFDAIAKSLERETEAHKQKQDALAKFRIGGDTTNNAAGDDPKTHEKLVKAKLDSSLSAIKAEQEAAKNKHDIDLALAESKFKADELALKKLALNEQEFNTRSLDLKKALDDQKLKVEAEYLQKAHDLNLKAIDEKIKAEQAAIVAPRPSKASLAGLIAGGESSGDAYNAFNRGTSGNKILPATRKEDLTALTIGEIMSRQALSITNEDRLGAVGKYQVIASTLKEAVSNLRLSADTKFDAATQEKIFTEYLLDAKRPSVKQFITGGTDNVNGTIRNLSQEFASIANPDTGKSFYDGKGGNTASISAAQVESALVAARSQFQQAKAGGADNETAFKLSLSGSTGAGGNQQASNESVKALKTERLAETADFNAKMKLLGISANNDRTEQSTEELAITRQAAEEQKAIHAENSQAEYNAALDALAVREQAAQLDLDLGAITQAELLEKQKGFADERLAIEEKLLDDKRKLLKNDELALLQNLHAKEQAERDAAARRKKIEDDLAKDKQAVFEGAVAPFESAVSQMTNGVLTGQQTIKDAVRNAANSILTSYAATFIKQRALQMSQWAWQKAGLALNLAEEQALKEGDLIWATLMFAKRKAMDILGWNTEVAGTAATEAKKRTIKSSSSLFDMALNAGKRIRMSVQWAWEVLGETALAAKKRAIKLAGSAFDNLLLVGQKIKLAAFWAWDLLGFGTKEAAKASVKVGSEAIQTGAQVAGDATRTVSTVTSEKISKQATAETTMSKMLNYAVTAAAATYASVASIPYVGWILAPVAAAATFAGVMAFGAMASFAKGGEMEVGSDNAPYFLHKRESVLPAGVADNFRKVVQIVNNVAVGDENGTTGSLTAPPAAIQAFNDLIANNSIPRSLSVPAVASNIVTGSENKAASLAKQRFETEQSSVASASSGGRSGGDNFHIHAMDSRSFEQYLSNKGPAVAKILRGEHRKFNKGSKR